MHSVQTGFCNCCGKKYQWKMGAPFIKGLGNRHVCSINCFKEEQHKETLSIMGKEYYPRETTGAGQ